MAKDYLCKDCVENNNGWCNKRKFNGLKKITECEFKKSDEVEVVEKDVDHTPYKQFGERENFFHMQQQIIAINERNDTYEEKWNALNRAMKSIGDYLEVNEKIFGVATEYLVDEDILDNSKKMNKNWFEIIK